MRVGFTGTQRGLLFKQMMAVENLVVELNPDSAAHGDCIGADEEFHRICRGLGGIWIVGHPPFREGKRAWCNFDEVREPLDYLDRNQVIVNECDLLIAAPKGMEEELRSGTWSTVRYCRSLGKKVIIVFPDGSVSASE